MNATERGHAPSEPDSLPLAGLFLHLVRAGFALSARDYFDALRALRMGHGVGGRDALHELCRRLWARSEEELLRLDDTFRMVRPPTAAEVRCLTQSAGRATAAAQRGHPQGSPTPDADGDEPLQHEPEDVRPGADAPRAEFGAAGEAGVGLPSVTSTRRANRPYVHEPQPPLPERSLVVAWRRLRRQRRDGPPVELDIDATVAEQCRTGWLVRPALVPARRNRMRLVVLVDASPSMRPWRRLYGELAASLAQGRLARADVLYFDNDPREGLYATPRLRGWQDPSSVLAALDQTALMVIGDAGCARGRNDLARLAGMKAFVHEAVRHCQALAWINPLPRERWGGLADQLWPAAMFELSDDGLTRAVDVLRGARSA